jgi:hypothetical protein
MCDKLARIEHGVTDMEHGLPELRLLMEVEDSRNALNCGSV